MADTDFCLLLLPLQTSIAATMFPHLCQRLFAARSEAVMRRGMTAMNFRCVTSYALRAFQATVMCGPVAQGPARFTAACWCTLLALFCALWPAAGLAGVPCS